MGFYSPECTSGRLIRINFSFLLGSDDSFILVFYDDKFLLAFEKLWRRWSRWFFQRLSSVFGNHLFSISISKSWKSEIHSTKLYFWRSLLGKNGIIPTYDYCARWRENLFQLPWWMYLEFLVVFTIEQFDIFIILHFCSTHFVWFEVAAH